jgi:predicted ABC-type ATPase
MRNQSPVSFTVIRGTYGIGKSLLIRVVLQRIKMDEHKYLKEDTLTVVVNSLGPMSNQLKANGFR